MPSGSNYMICDMEGVIIQDDVPEHMSHHTAQQVANDRGCSVMLMLYFNASNGGKVIESQQLMQPIRR